MDCRCGAAPEKKLTFENDQRVLWHAPLVWRASVATARDVEVLLYFMQTPLYFIALALWHKPYIPWKELHTASKEGDVASKEVYVACKEAYTPSNMARDVQALHMFAFSDMFAFSQVSLDMFAFSQVMFAFSQDMFAFSQVRLATNCTVSNDHEADF